MFIIFTLVMLRDTHSEPGAPVNEGEERARTEVNFESVSPNFGHRTLIQIC